MYETFSFISAGTAKSVTLFLLENVSVIIIIIVVIIIIILSITYCYFIMYWFL
jgi:hypothetical protein